MRIRIIMQANNALTHWTGCDARDYSPRMSILAENVSELIGREKTQSDFAARVGIEQSTASRIAKGAQPKPENLISIARHAGVSVETLVEVPIAQWPTEDREKFKAARLRLGWSPAIMAQEVHAIVKRERGKAAVTADAIERFESGAADETPWMRFARMAFEEGGSAKSQDTSARDELAYVRQVDIRYAMGAGAAVEDYPATQLVPFNLDFLHTLTRAPLEKVMLASGFGDSMDPTIKEHDLVMIDATETQLGLGDTIWAFEYAGVGYIKRLRPFMREGRRFIEVISDNKAVADPFEADPQDIHIVGKIILLIRRRP